MYRIKRKPLSVNRAWKGRRFRSVFYSVFHTAVSLLLNALRPKRPPENRPLFAHYRWGVSNMMADTDNPTKPFQDVLFEHWGMKDHHLQFLILEKVKTPKGQEFIDFWVRDEDELIEYLQKLLDDMRCSMNKRKKRITKRNEMTDDFGGKPPHEIYDIDHMRVAEFMPALPNAKSEVHMNIYLKSDPDRPLTMRFKSPDTLGDWISVLAEYRKRVFPDADPIEVNPRKETHGNL